MSSGFQHLLSLINNGEVVDATVTNRTSGQLQQSLLYLKGIIDALELGQNVIARDQTLASDASVGMPVYYKGSTQRYERALGAILQDETTGAYVMADSSQVWGVVLAKSSATKGDILLHGMAELDLSLAVPDGAEAGLYYLSNSVAGRLDRQRPPVGVAVLQVAGETDDDKHVVYVNVQFDDLRSAHSHYAFELVAEPAGDTTPSDPHVITNSNETLEGWLPADDASFDGNAPTGAKFGYNIAASQLRYLWPPQPLESAYLEVSRGENVNLLSMGAPTGVGQLCIFDRHGIWWMSDCEGDAPWPADLDTDSSLSLTDECPRRLAMQLKLWFTRPVFSSNSAWVESLVAVAGSGLEVTCVDDGSPASVGHLQIDFDAALTLADEDLITGIAIKAIDGRELQTGPVVSTIKGAGPNVLITSDQTTREDGSKIGAITLAVDYELDGREVPVDLVRLDSAEQEVFDGVMGIGFNASRLASVRSRFQLPALIDFPSGTQMKLRLVWLARGSVTIPEDIFSLSYRRLALPSAVHTPLSLPLSAAEVTLADIPTENVVLGGINKQVMMESEPFDVEAGETIYVTITRAGDSDGYTGDLWLLRQTAVYVVA